MTESSVSSPFMTKLRELLPGAEVIKHRDASFVGLPDCSVTFQSHTLWLEFKLYPMLVRWETMDGLELAHELLSKAVKSKVQAATMMRMRNTSMALYVIWLRKNSVMLIDPKTLAHKRFSRAGLACEHLARLCASWEPWSFPSL